MSNAMFFMSKEKKISIKGQIKPKADWCAVDTPKKQMNEFVLFVFLLFTAKKTNLFVFRENLRRANSAFGFI